MKKRNEKIKKTIKQVCNVMGLKERQLFGKPHPTDVSLGRKLLFFILIKDQELRPCIVRSFIHIYSGRKFSHSTILMNVEKAEKKISKKDDEFTTLLSEIREGL